MHQLNQDFVFRLINLISDAEMHHQKVIEFSKHIDIKNEEAQNAANMLIHSQSQRVQELKLILTNYINLS
jgi:hypothetical protein